MVIVATVAACGSGSDDASSSAPAETVASASASASAETTMAAAATTAVPTEAASGDATAPAPALALPVALADRSIIRSAAMTVAVDDIETAVRSVTQVATAVGGAVFGTDVRLDDPPAATMVVRMPPADLQQAIEDIGALGRIVQRTQDAQDVTAQVVDLAARIASAEASVDRVRSFLDRAQNVNELAKLEAELTARETTLEQLRAQQRGLGDQVDLATLTVELIDLDDAPEISLAGLVETDEPGIIDAFRSGTSALLTGARYGAVALAAALPFLVLLALLALPLRWWLRHRTPRPARKLPAPRPQRPLPPPVA
jgi:Domain of unknown function (DUF4349)